MRRNRRKRNGQIAYLRLFAWLTTLFLALLGWGTGGRLGLALQLTAALMFAVGTLWPSSFQGLYRLLGPVRRPSTPLSLDRGLRDRAS